MEGGVPDLLEAAIRHARTRLTGTNRHHDRKEHIPARSEPTHAPGKRRLPAR